MLEPVVENMHYDAADSYFVMKSNEFHAIKAEGESVKVPAGKAVLHLTSGQAGARAAILEVDEDDATAIRTVSRYDAETNAAVYDMNGRKLNGIPAGKGLYIIGGKKVVVK